MPLSIADRKHLLGKQFGVQRELAAELGVHHTYVSRVVNGEVIPKTLHSQKKLRRTQVAIARKLRRRVAEVFPKNEQAAEPTMARAS